MPWSSNVSSLNSMFEEFSMVKRVYPKSEVLMNLNSGFRGEMLRLFFRFFISKVQSFLLVQLIGAMILIVGTEVVWASVMQFLKD